MAAMVFPMPTGWRWKRLAEVPPSGVPQWVVEGVVISALALSIDPDEKCVTYVVSTAVVGTLALLTLLLTFLWIRFCPSRLDSYTPSTRVMLLLPPTHLLHANQVACVVHGVSNLVQVSWDVPGDLQQKALTLMVKNSSGSVAFASLLPLPRDWQWAGKNFTCKVRFNSSGPTLKKSAVFPAPSPVDSDRKCLKYMVPTAVAGLLALLVLILCLLWIRLYPSRLGFTSRVPEPLSFETSQEDICYAQLDFPPRTSDGNQRNGASQGKKRKM